MRTQSGAAVRAKREKALFNHVFNKAREWGYTSQPNPCAGIRGAKEKGRKSVYITDRMYSDVYDAAEQPLKDAMDLAYLTGQRPSDVLKMTERDIDDGALCVVQNKTGAKLRIIIEGELAMLLARISARKAGYKVISMHLIVNETGQPIKLRALQDQFHKARDKAGVDKDSFQFRDLRTKAGTDKTESFGDIRQAQKQLGHSNITTTEHYIRGRKGEKVKPTK
jgi:integrase